MKSPATERLYQVEDELRAAERRIAEMKAERDDAWNLVQRKQEYVEDVNATIESWIEAFEMTLGDDGMWHSSGEHLIDKYHSLIEKHNALVREWNKLVREYNGMVAPKQIGRPLNASDAQCAEVLRLRKAGTSLQDIADDTSLSLRTVRTIIGRDERTD